MVLRDYKNHGCEGQIEKSVPRVTVCHHEACRVMSDSDRKGPIFLSVPHTHDRLFFFHTKIHVEKSVPRDQSLTSLGMPRDARQ